MIYKILFLLLGLISGSIFYIYGQYISYTNAMEDKVYIEKRLQKIEEKKHQLSIEKLRDHYQNSLDKHIIEQSNKEINNKKSIDEIDNGNYLKFKIYDFGNIYTQIYDFILSQDIIKDQVGHESFEQSGVNKYLQQLKENSILVEVLDDEGKRIEILNTIPIQISCIDNKLSFCPKVINDGYNEIFQKEVKQMKTNNLIFIRTSNITLTEDNIKEMILNKKLFQDYLNN